MSRHPTCRDLKKALATLLRGIKSPAADRAAFFRYLSEEFDFDDFPAAVGDSAIIHTLSDLYEDSLDGTPFSTLPDVEIDPVPVVPKQALRMDKKGRVRLSQGAKLARAINRESRAETCIQAGEGFDLKVDPKGKKLNKVSVSKLSHALNQARLNAKSKKKRK